MGRAQQGEQELRPGRDVEERVGEPRRVDRVEPDQLATRLLALRRPRLVVEEADQVRAGEAAVVLPGEADTALELEVAGAGHSQLFGGGSLFRSLLDAGLVDAVEVAVIPVLLCEGIPLLPPGATRPKLKLTGHKVYKTGIVLLEYVVA